MKKILLIMILVNATISSQAQNKCKYDVNAYDKFLKTNKIEKEVKVNKANFDGNGYLTINFCKYDSLMFFRVVYITRKSTVVGRNDALMFLLEDETTVKALPNEIYASHSRASTNQEVLNATYFFEESDAMYKLKSQKVKSIRIYFNSVYQDHDIKGKFSDDLNNAAKCF